jgi:hypothetical protein
MSPYEAFWSKLSVHYPVSKGALRLPIATELLSIPGFDYDTTLTRLRKLLQHLITEHGSAESAKERAKHAGEAKILPLITEELTGVVRFDCVLDGITGALKVVEINCDYPDGLLLHDKTYSIVSDTECTLHEDLYLQLFSEPDNAYVLHHEDASFVDAYQTEADLLAKSREVAIGSDLDIAKKYKIIKRSLEVSKLSDTAIASLDADKNRFINTFNLRTLGYKDLLSTIDNPLVPKTFLLSTSTAPQVIAEKDTLVIKPLNGCEGAGVYFGQDMHATEWSELVTSVSNENYVAQELISMERIPVRFYEAGTIKTKTLYFDICPHFFIKHGEIIGTGHSLIRFSDNKVVNVAQGGGIGYYRL